MVRTEEMSPGARGLGHCQHFSLGRREKCLQVADTSPVHRLLFRVPAKAFLVIQVALQEITRAHQIAENWLCCTLSDYIHPLPVHLL